MIWRRGRREEKEKSQVRSGLVWSGSSESGSVRVEIVPLKRPTRNSHSQRQAAQGLMGTPGEGMQVPSYSATNWLYSQDAGHATAS